MRKAVAQLGLAVLAAPTRKRGPSIDIAWNLASGEFAFLDYAPEPVGRFEETVAGLPGFEQAGTMHRLLVEERFGSEDARTLLEAMLALRAAAGGDV